MWLFLFSLISCLSTSRQEQISQATSNWCKLLQAEIHQENTLFSFWVPIHSTTLLSRGRLFLLLLVHGPCHHPACSLFSSQILHWNFLWTNSPPSLSLMSFILPSLILYLSFSLLYLPSLHLTSAGGLWTYTVGAISSHSWVGVIESLHSALTGFKGFGIYSFLNFWPSLLLWLFDYTSPNTDLWFKNQGPGPVLQPLNGNTSKGLLVTLT